MAYLVDGNNLMHALIGERGGPGRQGLVSLLAALVERGERVHVVFDGPPPPEGMRRQIASSGVRVSYSRSRTADDLLAELIAADSGPRELVVVSSDREVRRSARRRRCHTRTSESFAKTLRSAAGRSPGQGRSSEPPEKTAGLSPEQTAEWLREFGID